MRQRDKGELNQAFDEAIRQLGTSSIAVHLAAVDEGDKQSVVAGALRAVSRGDQPPKQEVLKYSRLRVIHASLPVDMVRIALNDIEAGVLLEVPEVGHLWLKGWLQRIGEIGSHEQLGMEVRTDRPSTYFEVTLDVTSATQQFLRDTQPLQGSGRLYPNPMTALFKEVFEVTLPSNTSAYNCVGDCHLVIPHPGSYLEEVVVRDKELTFTVGSDRAVSSATQTDSVDLYLETDGAPFTERAQLEGPSFTRNVSDRISRALLYLLGPDGEIVDEYDRSFPRYLPLNALSSFGQLGDADTELTPPPATKPLRSQVLERFAAVSSPIPALDLTSTRAGESRPTKSPRQNARRKRNPLDELHPLVKLRCQVAFATKQYSSAILNAYKLVETELRHRIGAPATLLGTDLASKALRPDNPILVVSNVLAEQDAAHMLFRGAIGLFKNPHSHRFTEPSGAQEASETLATASLLLRILDRSERRVLLRGVGEDDDHALMSPKGTPLLIDFEQLLWARFRINPADSTRQWRLGLRLRANKSFVPARYAPSQALVHLFRDGGEDRLRVMYLDQEAAERAAKTQQFPGIELEGAGDYVDGEVLLSVERHSDGLHVSVSVSNEPVDLGPVLSCPEHRFAQVWAWADGLPYELAVSYSLPVSY